MQYTVFTGTTERDETVTLYQNEKAPLFQERRLPPIEGTFYLQVDDGDALELSPDAEISLSDFGDHVELQVKSAEWTGSATGDVTQ